MRRVLIIAYYFPPMGLSGVQRTAKFAKYLPSAGWEPTVLTAHPGGYYAFDDDLLEEVKRAGVRIERTASLDPTQFFGRGRRVNMPDASARKRFQNISQWLFIPDNKIGWMPFALARGLQLLRNENYDAIFSTAPPYTCHLIGAALSRITGIPLTLDFRDDWLENPYSSYPTPLHRRLHDALERTVVRQCVTPIAINTYIRDSLAKRHPAAAENMRVIPQGYDAEDFEDLQIASTNNKMTFLYGGVFYEPQTPVFFLEGVHHFLQRHPAAREDILLAFVGYLTERHQTLIDRFGLREQVRLMGYRPHDEAVRQLSAADVLWMTVGRQKREEQISTGKLFEYFGARKPVLGLVPAGAARDAIITYRAGRTAPPDEPDAVGKAVEDLYFRWKKNDLPEPDEAFVQSLDRRRLAQKLAELL